jgi:hypothetical protein
MYSLVLDGEAFNVPMIPLITNCRIFQANRALLGESYEVQSGVSADWLRVFISAIGRAEAATSNNVVDLERLCGEFAVTAFRKRVEDQQSADSWRELHLLRVMLAE